jgi:hypothetical protein
MVIGLFAVMALPHSASSIFCISLASFPGIVLEGGIWLKAV